MDLDNLDIGLEELDIKSVDINPAANINRTGSPSISLTTGVNPGDRKSTRLNSSHVSESRMPSSA